MNAPSLYSITAEMNAILSLIEDGEGELTPELEQALAITEEQFTQKAEDYGHAILNLKAMATAAKDKVLKFFSGIISTTQSESKTLETLRVRLLRNSTNTLKMPATVKQKLIIKAWNYFDKGKEVQSLLYDQNRDADIWFE